MRNLDNVNVDVREKAASNLEDIKYDLLKYVNLSLLKKVVPKLMEKLDDQSGKVRYYIACTLESISSKLPELFKDKIPKLIEKLDEFYEKVYRRESYYTESHSALYYRDPREKARDHIAYILKNVAREFPELFMDKIPKLIEKQPKTIEKIIPKLKEITFKVITETSTFEEYYLENLTRLLKQTIIKKDPKATKNLVSKLIEKLNHPSEEVRKRVIWTLGEIGEEEPEIVKNAIQKLMEKLSDPSEKVRQEVAKALQKIDQPSQK